MSHNSFGTLFTITTFGESHGPGIGVVIDGCPAGLAISVDEIAADLAKRAPGNSPLTSPRKEADIPEILSGIFEGKSTGAPMTIWIASHDAKSEQYQSLTNILRPGHANFTYLAKYGIFDPRGGGRASARETAARVAAGSIAKQFLRIYGIECKAFIENEEALKQEIEAAKACGDSVGGIVSFSATGVPAGLGDPMYQKLEAKLAFAMLSIPAAKGFEIGHGFTAAHMRGSYHNDPFHLKEGKATPKTNHAGGILGGISTGEEILGKVAFKPTSTIQIPTETVTLNGEATIIEKPASGRHDPCIAIRAVFVVEAMLAITLADSLLLNRTARL